MSSKIKIMFMINNLYGGGAEKVLQTLLGQLNQDIYDITLYGVKNEKFDTSIYPKGIMYRSVFDGIYNGGSGKKGFIAKLSNKIKLFVYNNLSPKLFYRWFIKGEYDVEVAFIEGYSTKIISGSSNKSTKVSWVHIDLEANHWSKIAYKSLSDEIHCYKKFDHIVCVSESVKTTFGRKFGVKDTLRVCYNPMDVNDIITKSKETLELNNDSEFLISAMGRLEDQKGFDRLIEASKMLLDEKYNFKIWILGEGNDRKKLENQIREYQLEDKIILLGFQSNPYKYLKKSDLFICSSRSEGFSLVLGEAFILNIPVVSTNCSGPDELLNFGEFGVLTENSTKGIYDGLKKVLDDKTFHKQLKDKSKQRALFFNLDTTVGEIEKLWR